MDDGGQDHRYYPLRNVAAACADPHAQPDALPFDAWRDDRKRCCIGASAARFDED